MNLHDIQILDAYYSGSERMITYIRSLTDEESVQAKDNHSWPWQRAEEVSDKVYNMTKSINR